jgi:hypothetical protein
MALIALSGVGYSTEDKRAEMEAYRDKLVRDRDRLLQAGVITPGSSKELQYKVAINKVTVALQDLPSVNGIGQFDWQNAFSSLVSAAPDIISASRPGGGYVPSQYQQPFMPMQQQPEQRSGLNTNTLLLIGGAALAAFLIFKKK